MKTIFLSEIKDPEYVLESLSLIYKKIKEVASKDNDLRNYLKAQTMVESLNQAKDMYARYDKFEMHNGHKHKVHYYWTCKPCFIYIEDSDSIEAILNERFKYVYHPGPIG